MAQYRRLHETIEEYLTYRFAKCAPTTATNEAFVLRRFAAWYGDVQMRHLTPERVADWFFGDQGLLLPHRTRDRRLREPVKATTANYYRTRLASFFRWATKRGLIRRDLLEEVEPLTPERPERLKVPPSDLLRLLGTAGDARDRAFIALLINTGFRGGTATSLRVRDVDLDAESISVWISKSRVHDWFPITADLRIELAAWLREYSVTVRRPLRTDDFLFPARTASVYHWVVDAGGQKRKIRTAPTWTPERPLTHPERVVQEALRALGFTTKGEGCHTIRRSVARALFDALASEKSYDAALRTVTATLHHKSMATTEIYLGLSSELAQRDAALRGKPFLSAMCGQNAAVAHIRPTGTARLR